MKYLQSLFNRDVFQSVRKTSLIVSGWLCTVGGLVADVLQPVAPFVSYLFFLSVAILVVLSILYAIGKKELLGALILAGISTTATGLFALFQTGDEAEERGVVASSIPAVASLQESLGLIEKKLDEIKEDTQSIKESATRIESKSDAMLKALDVLNEGIGNDGGIIQNPTSPEDHYHNARLQELGGDYSAARRSYLEFFKSDLPRLDPHLRFISFLKVQEGTAGARETYNEVTARSPGPIPAYARLLLQDPQRRKTALANYASQNPDFAPAAYHLSLEYSQSRLGSQTLSDKREELVHLKAFQSADASGGLLRYFIDQELVQEWRDDASTRLTAIESQMSAEALENPVSLSWMANNSGWNGNIQIAEPALDIKWNVKGSSSPQSVGMSGFTDPNTGRPTPQSFFSLPKNQSDSVIEIRYTDASGIERGPYEFAFTAQKESDDGNRRILEATSTSWLSFRDYDGSVLLYFTHLLSYRGALSKIEYGLNQESPHQNFEFPPWDKPGIAMIDGSFPMFLTVPGNTTFATVRLTYKNGDTSQVMRFDRQ